MSKANDAKPTLEVSALEAMEVQPGEQVSRNRSIDTDNHTVRLYNVSKNDKTGKNYKVNWTFDFSSVSQEQLLELASRSAVIAYRKHFRNVPEDKITDYADLTVDVLEDVLTQERKGQSAGDKAKKLFDKMTEEEKQKVLQELGLS